MAKTDKIHGLKEAFLRIIYKFKQLEKVAIDHGTGDLLFASEINTLEIIGKFPCINLTQIARKRGVTKGAVSQIVAKLVKKGLVVKKQALDNGKTVALELTDRGAIAFQNHENFHAKYDSPMIAKLNGMSVDQLNLVTGTFEMLENTIDSYLKDLK